MRYVRSGEARLAVEKSDELRLDQLMLYQTS